jgi:hypothetical protein
MPLTMSGTALAAGDDMVISEPGIATHRSILWVISGLSTPPCSSGTPLMNGSFADDPRGINSIIVFVDDNLRQKSARAPVRKKGALVARATRAKWFLGRAAIVRPCKRSLARSSSVLFGLGWDRRRNAKSRRMTNSRHRKTGPASHSGRRTTLHEPPLPVRRLSLVTLRLKPRK